MYFYQMNTIEFSSVNFYFLSYTDYYMYQGPPQITPYIIQTTTCTRDLPRSPRTQYRLLHVLGTFLDHPYIIQTTTCTRDLPRSPVHNTDYYMYQGPSQITHTQYRLLHVLGTFLDHPVHNTDYYMYQDLPRSPVHSTDYYMYQGPSQITPYIVPLTI